MSNILELLVTSPQMSQAILFSLGANTSGEVSLLDNCLFLLIVLLDIGLPRLAQQYFAVDGESPSSLSVYFLDRLYEAEAVFALASVTHPEYDLRTYKLYSDTANNVTYPTSDGIAPVLQVLQINIAPDYEAEFNEWYEDEHINLISHIPGWRRTRRYTVEEYSQEEPIKFLTFHEWTRVVPNDDPGVIAVGETEWAQKIIPLFSALDSRNYNLTTELD